MEPQTNDGRGGDGGVDALWTTADGKKLGYQAKYVWSFGDAQLRQMQQSVDQAIATHHDLKKYIFAIPFDPTADRGPKDSSRSGWEKWNERVVKWKEQAAEKGIRLEFELWTKTVIAKKLFQKENSGILRRWFDEEVLDDTWFCSQIDSATQRLNDRFNPGDHVNVDIESLFDTLVRGPTILEKISSAFSRLNKAKLPKIEFKAQEYTPDKTALAEIDAAWDSLVQLAESFEQDLSAPWLSGEALKLLSSLQKATWKLEKQYISVDKKFLEEADQREFDLFMNRLNTLISACSRLKEILDSPYIAAEKERCSLVYGPAGAGKSHLLARVAEERVKAGIPTILLLGQDYSSSAFWRQTGELLGLKEQTPESILEMLNTVGQHKRQRILLLFDAINEGAGAGYWHSEIPSVIKKLKNYSHVAAVFSCREEYLPYAVPKNLLDSLPKYRISGFSSPEEMEQAAINYLDKRRISRPNTPWLAPEFRNPLFLKITSEALEKKRETEFPKGLRGISKIIALYLDALSDMLKTAPASAVNISDEIKHVVQEVAQKMAESGKDFLNEPDARDLVTSCFPGRTAPASKTWLQILSEASLFRIDPPPIIDDVDPLKAPPNRVRFTFQRFQDYLMAKALTKQVRKGHETKAFAPKGPLSFLLIEHQHGTDLDYWFTGLVGALSTTFPEELDTEFATVLPKWKQIWMRSGVIQSGFAESLRWRKADAFTDQTLDLLNNLDGHHVDVHGLLLEVSMTVEHPYNALFLHNNMKRMSLPKRDSFWTCWINRESRHEDSQVDRIVSWALALLDRPADIEHLKLASIVLAWCLSSSYMTLRDRATKALSTIFLLESSVFEFVARLTHDCDDPYVIERLYAAAFGACCMDPKPDRLSSYSKLIYDLVFADGNPPVGLLARDYALGVIELAKAKGSLSKEISLRDCHPPFSSTPPNFGLTKNKVEGIAKKSGGKQIFVSIISGIADYGTYTIPGRVQNFLTTPLNESKPLTKDEIKAKFFAQIIEPFPERVEALNDLEECMKRQRPTVIFMHGQKHLDDDTRKLINQRAQEQKRVRKALDKYLSEDEKKRLSSEYLKEGKARENENRLNLDQCKLWVTKRAYDLGWASDLFPKDYEGSSLSSSHNDLERIGKKYQRIALDELQARLADNFWMIQGSPEEVTTYRYDRHNSFRNIEPTILPTTSRYGNSCKDEFDWITQPRVSLPPVHEKDLSQWPFQSDPTTSFKGKIFRTDKTGRKWLVLYEFSLDSKKHSDPNLAEHGVRYEEFRFIYCMLTQSGKSAELVKHLRRKKSLDVSSFQPREFTDGPYLLEAHWRDTWKSEKFSRRIWGMPNDLEFAVPVADYHWESHLDKTLPEGFSKHLPQKWFAEELELKMADRSANSWMDSEGCIVLTSVSGDEGRSTVVIEERTFADYASQFNVEPVWIMIAERNAWPSGKGRRFKGRRSEAVAWYDSGKLRKRGWKHDN